MQQSNNILIKCLTSAFAPLARFCVRRSIKFHEVAECWKIAMLEAARTELARTNQTPTQSRLSIMTGVHRRDVGRFEKQNFRFDDEKDLIKKILGQWQTDKRFLTKTGAPRVLSYGSDQSDFTELVKLVSKDLNPATILFELERVRAINRTDSGIKLCSSSYIPKGNLEQAFRIIGSDFDDLIAAVEENIEEDPSLPNLHLRTEYDRVRPDSLPEIRAFLLKEGNALHRRIRDFVSVHDQDVNPDPKFSGKGTKIAIGSFSKVYENK